MANKITKTTKVKKGKVIQKIKLDIDIKGYIDDALKSYRKKLKKKLDGEYQGKDNKFIKSIHKELVSKYEKNPEGFMKVAIELVFERYVQDILREAKKGIDNYGNEK